MSFKIFENNTKPKRIIIRGINIAKGGIIITKRAYTIKNGERYLNTIFNSLFEKFPKKRTTR